MYTPKTQKGMLMPVARRNRHPQQLLTMKQVAYIILTIYGNSHGPSERSKEQPNLKFKLQETVIQQLLGMPIDNHQRKHIIRELNLLGWDVAINSKYWLIFIVSDLESWHDAGTFVNDTLVEALLTNPEPNPFGLIWGLNVTANEVAKFHGYTEQDIINELAQLSYERCSEEDIEEYQITGDESVLGIEEGQELPIDFFTFWDYIDFYLAKQRLDRNAPVSLNR